MEKLEAKEGRVGVKDIVTRKVGVLGVVGMFYAMCCAGAFGVEELIPEVGPGMTIAILVILPFAYALPYSYIVAELGSARPVEGGNIVWVKEALGEFWFGIMVFVNFIWGLVANTVYVVLAVDYL
ncbi:MAG: APC family permease, partial [Clostridiales Family XIII bacterium]|nr:APC family permease [Clostridiales Family XIII bacterium]